MSATYYSLNAETSLNHILTKTKITKSKMTLQLLRFLKECKLLDEFNLLTSKEDRKSVDSLFNNIIRFIDHKKYHTVLGLYLEKHHGYLSSL